MIEGVLAALALFGALYGLACLAPRGRGTGPKAMAAAGLVSIAAGAWYGTDDRAPFKSAGPPTDRVLEVPSHDYLSSDSCRSCHPGRYATWDGSYHESMTQVVDPASVQAEFPGELEVRGRRYRLERVGDEFWGTFPIDDDAAGATTAKRVRFTQVTGSHHFQVFWYSYGDQRGLGMFPLYFHLEERRWIPWSSVFLMPHVGVAHEDVGRWNVHCVKCHTTDARAKVMDTGPAAIASAETVVGEYGISCESCHGPGAEHVAKHKSPLSRYAQHFTDDTDTSIVNPARLDPVRSSHACAQCHSIHAVTPNRFADAQANGSPYRPGDDLEETHVVYGGRRPRGTRELARTSSDFVRSHFWSDGMVRVGGREFNGLMRSPCFTHGDVERGVMACTSCHREHRASDDPRPLAEWADDQLERGMRGNEACLQCHEDYRETSALEAHTGHGAASVGSECMNCHMPNTTWGLMKATRQHEVTSPSVTSELETGRPNACSLCHLDRSLGWTQDELVTRYGHERVTLDDVVRDAPAGVRVALSGDAGQRALVAWAMSWAPALEASGTEWIPRTLAELLVDPYDAIRFNAERALRELEGYGDIEFDFLASEASRDRARAEVLSRSAGESPGYTDADVQRMLGARDNTPIRLTE